MVHVGNHTSPMDAKGYTSPKKNLTYMDFFFRACAWKTNRFLFGIKVRGGSSSEVVVMIINVVSCTLFAIHGYESLPKYM